MIFPKEFFQTKSACYKKQEKLSYGPPLFEPMEFFIQLDQPRKTCLDMTKKTVDWDVKNQIKQNHPVWYRFEWTRYIDLEKKELRYNQQEI